MAMKDKQSVPFPANAVLRKRWIHPEYPELRELPWLEDKHGWNRCSPVLLKQSRSRWTIRIGESGQAIVVKRYLVDRPVRGWISSIWPSKARLELNISQRIFRFGLPTPQPLACFELWEGWRLAASYLVTRYLENSQNLAEWLTDVPTRLLDDSVLFAVGDVIGRLHAHRIAHEDCSAYNLLVRLDASTPEDRIVLIDLDGCRRCYMIGVERRTLNLHQLAKSLVRQGLEVTPDRWQVLAMGYLQTIKAGQRREAQIALDTVEEWLNTAYHQHL